MHGRFLMSPNCEIVKSQKANPPFLHRSIQRYCNACPGKSSKSCKWRSSTEGRFSEPCYPTLGRHVGNRIWIWSKLQRVEMHYPTVPTQSATFLPNMDLKMAGEAWSVRRLHRRSILRNLDLLQCHCMTWDVCQCGMIPPDSAGSWSRPRSLCSPPQDLAFSP